MMRAWFSMGRLSVAIALLALSLAAAALGLGLGLQRGLSDGLIGSLVPALGGAIEVRPKASWNTQLSGEAPPTLSAEDLAALGAIEGVDHVVPLWTPRLATRAVGGKSLLGRALGSDVVLVGLDEAVFTRAGASAAVPGDAVPVLLSTHALDLFNRTLAPQLGLGTLSLSDLARVDMTLALGEGRLGTRVQRPVRATAVLAGTSPLVPVVAAGVPRAWLERHQRALLDAPLVRGAAWVTLAHGHALPAVVERIHARGLTTADGPLELARVVKLGARTLSLAGGLLLALAAAVAALAWMHDVERRRHALTLQRAFGLTRLSVGLGVAFRAFVLTTASTAVGLGVAWGMAPGFNAQLAKLAGDAAWVPAAGMVQLAPAVWAQVWLALLGAGALGSLAPMLAAVRLDPAALLRRLG